MTRIGGPAARPHPDPADLTVLVAELLADAEPGWTLHRGDTWCTATPAGRLPRDAGWKLHLSATPRTAQAVLRGIVPCLAAQRVAFKFAPDLAAVRLLGSRECDRAQAGKVITVYPRDDEEFVALADELDAATQGLAGPRILSDRAYRTGGVVHYRYGAFDKPAELTVDGVYRGVVLTPEGLAETDRREPRYTPPPWVTCPIPQVEEGTAGPRAVLLGDRFTVRAALRHSTKGGIYLADDAVLGGTVVVKQGRAHAEADESGRDARDAIRHEAEMLRLLAPTGLVPRLLATFTQDGDRFLVEEHLDRAPLRTWIGAHCRPGRGVPADAALELARRLVLLVAEVHRRGVVLRDLSPTNVLVDAAGLPAVVDLELAALAGARARRGGTPGYRAPEHDGPGPEPVAALTEDRYALGCLFFLLATGSDPLLPPDRPAGATPSAPRLLAWLDAVARDHEAARALRPAIAALLADDPRDRAPLSRVQRLLAPAAAAAPAVPAVSRPARPDRARLLRDGLDHLLATMTPDRTDRLWPAGRRAAFDPAAVQHGAAGVLGTLTAALAGSTDERRGELRDAVATAAGWLRRRAAAEPRRLPGLYFGRSGTAWALHDAGAALGDPDLVAAGVQTAAGIPIPRPVNPDVTHGLAGAGLAALHLWSVTGIDALRDRARRCADDLMAAAERNGGTVLWPVPPELDSELAGVRHYGFAHGAAGIGYFLLAAGAATGDGRATELALAAADTLCDAAVLDDGAAWWPEAPGGRERLVHWCNGSSGIGTFLLRAWRISRRERHAELAAAAAVAVHRARWLSLPSACHGLAGNGEFLLDAAALLDDPRLREWAEDLAEAAALRHCRREGRLLVADESGSDVVADAGTGLAGVLRFLLRLERGGARAWMVDEVVDRPASAVAPTTPAVRPPGRLGFRFSPSGRHGVCLVGRGGRYQVEAWSFDPPRHRLVPAEQPETRWTQPIPLDDGSLLVTRPIDAQHHLTLVNPDGTARLLGVVDAQGLRLIAGPTDMGTAGGASGDALGWALSTERDGTSRLWRVGVDGPVEVGRVQGIVVGGSWLDSAGRSLAFGCLTDGRMRPLVIDTLDGTTRPLSDRTDEGVRPLLCAPETGLLIVGRGADRLGWAGDHGRGPLAFPDVLRSTEKCRVWPLALDPRGQRVLLQLDEPCRARLALYRPGADELAPVPVPPGVIGGSAHWGEDVLRFPFTGPASPAGLAELTPPTTGRFTLHPDGGGHPRTPVEHTVLAGPAGPIEAVVHGDRATAHAVLLALHGGPIGAWRLTYDPLMHELAAAGLLVVAPNLRGGSGAGPRDEHTGRGAWGGPDLADLLGLARDLAADAGAPLRLLGASYGAFLALLAAGVDPGLWSHVVAVAPFASAERLYPEAGPAVRAMIDRLDGLAPVEDGLGERDVTRFAPAVTARVLLAHGTADDVVPVSQARAVRDALRAAGAAPRYLEYPGAGHGVLDDAAAPDLPRTVLAFLAAGPGARTCRDRGETRPDGERG
ncbi:class IV lanthionine synthetase LanL [Pseudonocardia sp. RS11V-5]|uniref:class IV lanthionine synthetase LanL n=1 Tax=Pseudonocardia terrae TaxID=2905831 RepID=UPI001E4D712F|nr:class IV lanthionine synthetase LanL [Pseudonocardia terrae]MCE3553038.1 class IV lanthionine synthetase LanL [Pseudonocardia terrae]